MTPPASTSPTDPSSTTIRPVRVIVIGAGSRGTQYTHFIHEHPHAQVSAVADPILHKRARLGQKYIWGNTPPGENQSFSSWKDFLSYEVSRRERAAKGEDVPEGVDAAFICVLDELHMEVIVGLKVLGLHVMCEKPLATRLGDCVSIGRALLPDFEGEGEGVKRSRDPDRIFSIGHVLRYSPHNMLMRKLLLEEKVIGDVVSVNHTEPVGWWHFTHSYVRGNWRKESTSGPSLLSKSCHDIDLLLWLLCSPPLSSPNSPPHLPTTITSTGALQTFTRARKPSLAGSSTNCLTCPVEPTCKYSSKKIYLSPQHHGLHSSSTLNTSWPVDIVVPNISSIVSTSGVDAAENAVLDALKEDYTASTPLPDIESRNWFGRCVFESDNDVLDDQFVALSFSPNPSKGITSSKLATFHLVSQTKKICERYTHIYGTSGEMYADSTTITVEDFENGETKSWNPKVDQMSGHGGGDRGLVVQFLGAVGDVLNGRRGVREAQMEWVGCDLEEVIRSHAVVFAAEEARKNKVVVDFEGWWEREVVQKLGI